MPEQNPAPEPTPELSAFPTITQQPVAVPTTPPPVFPVTPSRSHGLVTVFSIIGAVVLLGGAGAAAAYYLELGPFKVQQYSESSFLSSILAKSLEITNASYTATISLAVNPREEGATPFVTPPVNKELEEKYKNDVKRVSDLRAIVNDLRNTYGGIEVYDSVKKAYVKTAGKPFPKKLSSTDVKSTKYGTSLTDPVTKLPYAYVATEGSKNFTLTATLETDEAVNALKEYYSSTATGTSIDGRKMTVTKDSSYLYISSKLPRPFLVDLADMMRSIPPDVKGDVSVEATTDFQSEGTADWHFNLKANGDLGDMTYAVDLEALRKAANYYVRVNKLPSLFGDELASYKGQWIVISPSAASSTEGGYGSEFSYLARSISEAEVSYKRQRENAVEAGKKLNQLAEKHQLLVFKTDPKKDTVGSRSLYRYQLDIRKEAIIPFVKDVIEDAQDDRVLSAFFKDAGLLSYLESQDFDTTFDYLKKNIFYTVWTDRAGFPAVTEYRMRIVPPDTATQLADKQIDLVLKLDLSAINKGVNIEAPKDAKPIEQVISEVEANSRR